MSSLDGGGTPELPEPLGLEALRYTQPSEWIAEYYADRIRESYPYFTPRPYAEAAEDFNATFLPGLDELIDPAFLSAVVEQLTPAESYQGLIAELAEYVSQYGLVEALATKSVIVLTNHRRFSDLPLLAAGVTEALRNRGDVTDIQKRNVMIVGRMIPLMALDIFKDDDPIPVTPLMRGFSAQVQSVPGVLPHGAPKPAKDLAHVWNNEAKWAMRQLSQQPGHILYMAGSGTHDEVVRSGKQLSMQLITDQTAQILAEANGVVVPVFFSCEPFRDGKFEPEDMVYKLLPPREINSAEDAHIAMQDIAHIGSVMLRTEFSEGVTYPTDKIAKVKAAAKRVRHRPVY